MDRKPSKIALEEQRLLIVELQRKNEQSIKQYEYLKQTLLGVAINVIQPSKNPGDFDPPKHTLTGDTTVGVASSDPKLPQDDAILDTGATCFCGQASGASAANDVHIMPAELKAYASKLDKLFSSIQDCRRRLGNMVISPTFGCEESRRQLDSLIEDFEIVLVWQVSAVVHTEGVVVVQENTTEAPGRVKTEELGVETAPFERRASWRWRPKQWVSQLIQSRRSQSGEGAWQSMIRPVPGCTAWHVNSSAASATGVSSYTGGEEVIPGPVLVGPDGQSVPSVPMFKIVPADSGSPSPETMPEQLSEPEAEAEIVNRLLKDWTTLDESEIKLSEVDSA
jgi:hypothetical protein